MSHDDKVPDDAHSGSGEGPAAAAEEHPSDNESTIPMTPPRGVEKNFDASKLAPDDSCKKELSALQKTRQDLANTKKNLTKQLRKARRVRDRLKKKATNLTQAELCQIIAMKQDLANQWNSKHGGKSSGSTSSADRRRA